MLTHALMCASSGLPWAAQATPEAMVTVSANFAFTKGRTLPPLLRPTRLHARSAALR